MVEDSEEVDNFKPYRKTYDNLTELKNAQEHDEKLNGAVNFALELNIMQGATL